jgi:hypothetical protein
MLFLTGRERPEVVCCQVSDFGIERDERQNTNTEVAEGEVKERRVGEVEVRRSHNNRSELKVGEYQHRKYPRLKVRIKFRTILFRV